MAPAQLWKQNVFLEPIKCYETDMHVVCIYVLNCMYILCLIQAFALIRHRVHGCLTQAQHRIVCLHFFHHYHYGNLHLHHHCHNHSHRHHNHCHHHPHHISPHLGLCVWMFIMCKLISITLKVSSLTLKYLEAILDSYWCYLGQFWASSHNIDSIFELNGPL